MNKTRPEIEDYHPKEKTPPQSAGRVKVTNIPKDKKPTLASFKKSNASLLGHNNRQRVEIVKLKDERQRWIDLNGGFKKASDDAQKSLKTAEGTIADRDKEIVDLDKQTIEFDKFRERILTANADGAKNQIRLMKLRDRLIALSSVLGIALTATLLIQYGGLL